MAKRTRYASRSTARRPAANRLARREPPKAKPLVIEPTPAIIDPELADETGSALRPTGTGLSQAEIDRAAALEAEMATREQALAAARSRAASTVPTHAPVDVNAPLSVRAAKEYAYVARDVRRIIVTALLMVAILAVIDVLVNVLGVLKI